MAAGSLPAGVHTLRYVVRDGSLTVEDSVTFEVEDCPPTRPRILSPFEGEILVLEGLGVSVCFDATYAPAFLLIARLLARRWESR